MNFNNNVFINCPFDPEYDELFRPMVFTLMYLAFEPQICKTEDSGMERIRQIKHLIRISKYSIHDISRNKAKAAGEWPRFNMPFEMGLDFGCKEYGKGNLKDKACLIFETNKNDYDKYIGDISGNDIKTHENNPEILVQRLHEWLNIKLAHPIPSPATIYRMYHNCIVNVSMELLPPPYEYTTEEFAKLNIIDFMKAISSWIDNNKFIPQ